MIGLFQTPPEGVLYISTRDPALNLDATDLATYLKTFDGDYLKVGEGKTATKFYLRRLSLKQWDAVRGVPEPQRERLAVSYSVASVENFPTGKGRDFLRVSFTGDGEERRLDHDTIAAMYSPTLFDELSKVIVLLSGLDPLAGAR